MGRARFGAFPEGFLGRSHLSGHVACHLSWQPEPLAQILGHQPLQFLALRYLPAHKSDSGCVIQGVTVSQRRAPHRLLLLFSEQELQFAPQRLGGLQFIHVYEYYVSVVKHRRCAAALSLCRLERRGLPRKFVEAFQQV
jgi:uncharacterized membrane protein